MNENFFWRGVAILWPVCLCLAVSLFYIYLELSKDNKREYKIDGIHDPLDDKPLSGSKYDPVLLTLFPKYPPITKWLYVKQETAALFKQGGPRLLLGVANDYDEATERPYYFFSQNTINQSTGSGLMLFGGNMFWYATGFNKRRGFYYFLHDSWSHHDFRISYFHPETGEELSGEVRLPAVEQRIAEKNISNEFCVHS